MSQENDAKIKKLFDRLVELGAEDREAALPKLRKELGLSGEAGAAIEKEALSLLGFDERGGELPKLGAIRRTGEVIGKRFELGEELGRGGMGEVYLAKDLARGRNVALKFLLREMAQDREVRERFRSEVLLGCSVSHRNVVRIHDIHEEGEDVFLSMELLEGRTLAKRLKEGVLEGKEAQSIGMQLAEGLAAIHERGIVHRDLKPNNVFLESSGRVVIMDFGIAREDRILGKGLTRTGQFIGTPGYLAPEQIAGKGVTTKTDVYAWGLVMYEAATGESPFAGEVAMEQLAKRLVEEAPKLAVGKKRSALTECIDHCLAKEPERRPEMREVARDLKGLKTSRRSWIGVAAGAPLVAGGAYVLGRRSGVWGEAKEQMARVVRILVADLNEPTADPNLKGTLESVLGLALEGSPFVSLFSRPEAFKVAKTLGNQEGGLSVETARLVATREGLDVVVGGEIRLGESRPKLVVFAQDAATGRQLGSTEHQASGKADLVNQAAKAAQRVRKQLGEDMTEAGMHAEAETFTAKSLEAAHYYAVGQEQALLGEWAAAITAYTEATRLDPELGRAWSGMAVAYRNLGQTGKAIEFFQLALKNLNRMTERERFRTRGGYYVTQDSPLQALQEYQQLVKTFPADSAGHSNLALVNLMLRKAQPAYLEGLEAVRIYPKNRTHRNNLALYALCAGKYIEGLAQAQAVIQQDAKFLKGYLSKSLAFCGLGRYGEAEAGWKEVATISERGKGLGELGQADLAWARGSLKEAIQRLEASIDIEKMGKRQEGELWRRGALGLLLIESGDKRRALSEALAAGEAKDLAGRQMAGLALAQLGQDGGAERMASLLAEKVGPSAKSAALMVRGVAALGAGDAKRAQALLKEGIEALDTCLSRYWLGRSYAATGQWVEASAEYDVCHQRRGEFLMAFVDDLPTFQWLGALYYHRGLAEVGLNPKQSSSSLRMFVEMRSGAPEDAWLAEAKRLQSQAG